MVESVDCTRAHLARLCVIGCDLIEIFDAEQCLQMHWRNDETTLSGYTPISDCG